MSVCCVCNKSTTSLPESLIKCTKCKLFVHKECYGIPSQFSTAEAWLCQRCTIGRGSERCQLCPFSDGALKKTDNGGWAHILCAQYIPEVIFGNNYTMEPINLAEVPGPRFQQVCYICDEKGNDHAKRQGACMQCNVPNCINCFHVTCGQKAGLLVAEDCENRRIVDYYGFCSLHVKHKTGKADPPNSLPDRSGKLEKLPAVDTLTSASMKEVSKLLPNITSAPKSLPGPSEHPSINPVQPKVQAVPIPFQGVHRQESIIEGMQQDKEGLFPGKEAGTTTTSGVSTPSSAPVIKTRKNSSETDTAESEDLSAEPIVAALQSLSHSTGEKTRLRITKQSAPEEGSEAGEQYNDLMDLFKKAKERKRAKSPESELSDYMPYSERKRPPLHKKGKRGKIKKDPLRIRSLKSKLSVPHKSSSHNSYLYTSPPKSPVKVPKSKLVTGDKSYSPSIVVSKMIEETREPAVEDYKPCTGKPLISMDTFFDRFKEMGMQYMQRNCTSGKSRDLIKQIQDMNRINSHLANRIKAKSAKLEQLKSLNARLSVPYTKPLASMPEPAPISLATSKLLATVHKRPVLRQDTLLAETWLDKETVQVEEISKMPVPATLSALVLPKPPPPSTDKPLTAPPIVVTLPPPTASSTAEERTTPASDPSKDSNPENPGAAEAPQIIIAGDPPLAYTYNKDGALVGYSPESLQSSLNYNKVLEQAVEQHYKEKISAAYFEAQRRQYEGLLQHQMQSKMQASDYLTQAYLADPFAASYYYAQQQQQQSGRPASHSINPMPSLTPHFPSNPNISSGSYSALPARPPTSRSG